MSQLEKKQGGLPLPELKVANPRAVSAQARQNEKIDFTKVKGELIFLDDKPPPAAPQTVTNSNSTQKINLMNQAQI